MAMLAEPRRRKRYNLVPRGKALYEDDSRFGTKMLEKMGWKKGQGLGANEDGSKDFVRVRYKNDALGLGFEDRDDQWTQHEESFNGLLSKLSNENGVDAKMEKDTPSEDELQPRVGFGFQASNIMDKATLKGEKLKEKISGISLEEKSKQSKARVHYKKFTKGKDLAQYSEKDLANIFGKKAVDEQNAANDFYQQLSNTFGEIPTSGVQMINTGVTVNDYFKTKIGSHKNPQNEFDTTDNNSTSNEIQSEENSKKNMKIKKDIDEEIEKEHEYKSQIINSNVSINDYFKKKMDDLKNRKNGLNTQQDIARENGDEVKIEEPIKKKKKSKKDSKDKEKDGLENSKKSKHVSEYESFKTNINNDVAVEKKSKRSVEGNAEDHPLDEKYEAIVTKNGKKSKKCDIEESTELTDGTKKRKNKSQSKNKIQTDVANEIIVKKRKCDKSEIETELASSLMDPQCDIDLTQEPSKKKKKKVKNQNTTEITDVNAVENAESPTIKHQEKERNTSNNVKETSETTNNEDNLTRSNTKVSKPARSKRKNVSSTAKNVFVTDVDFQLIDLDEIMKQFNAFNIYPISTFCAEKFRNINANEFKGSRLQQLEGYGLGPELQLDVYYSKLDEERITNLWKGVLNKYVELGRTKTTYKNYIKEFCRARKKKEKFPQLNLKTFKRKNIFQLI